MIFVRELWNSYTAKVNGLEPELPLLPIQYGDFARWQRQRASEEAAQSQRKYWTDRLAGTIPALNLPTDMPRPLVQTFDGSRLPIFFSETLQDKLQAFSLENEVTLFVTLLSVFKVLLYRYTGQTDLVVGSPVLNRGMPEVEQLIGSFINTLVLRTNCWGKASFRDTLLTVRQSCVGAIAHQEFPFEKLVEELQPERDLAQNPIFRSCLLSKIEVFQRLNCQNFDVNLSK